MTRTPITPSHPSAEVQRQEGNGSTFAATFFACVIAGIGFWAWFYLAALPDVVVVLGGWLADMAMHPECGGDPKC